MEPELSIIIPVYNVERYIYQCLDSILSQQNASFEIIAVDDGSPDNCPAILDKYAEENERIIVIHQQNAGVSKARNAGLEKANGKWCYFVDSDDWLVQGQLSIALDYANTVDADVVFVDCNEQYENGKSKRIRLFSKPFVTAEENVIEDIQASVLCHKRNPYYVAGADSAYPAPWSKLIKTELIKNNKIHFEPFVEGIYDDGLFTLELLEKAKKIAYSDICLYNYRIISTSLVHSYKRGMIERFEKNCFKINEFIETYKKNDDFLASEFARRVAYLSSMLGVAYAKKGNLSRAEFISIIERSPWKEAIKNVNPRLLSLKHRYTLACLRMKITTGLKIYSKMKVQKTAGYSK